MKNGTLSDLIVEARKTQGLSQQELADLSGSSITVIYKLESGRLDLTLSSFLSVTQALGMRLKVQSPLGGELQLES
jgi:predicted transcriptional regulator